MSKNKRKKEINYPVITRGISNKKIGVLSGPSFAQEVIDYKPTAVVVAGELETIEKSTELFHTPEFRVYGSSDIIGTSVSGAMKNVIAIAAGIVYGLELGENARAAILTRGLAETAKLAKGLGGQTETVFGLAGAGSSWACRLFFRRGTGPQTQPRLLLHHVI